MDLHRQGRLCFFLILVCLFGIAGGIQNAESSAFSAPPEPIDGFGLVDLFPDIAFVEPVVIVSPEGQKDRIFVAERLGKIFAVTNLSAPVKTLFLDLGTSTVIHGGYEPGLLGFAFHPGFRTNGYFFVYRVTVTGDGYYNRLSRFRADPNSLVVRPDSEEIVLQQRDGNFIQHNAGDIHFGPDGYLYLALGEAAPPEEDYKLTRQPIDKNFFGVILRIDVDKRPGNLTPNPHPGVSNLYLVPRDNPFVGATEYQGLPLDVPRLRTEIFALGLRNPWRFCFDPTSGEIYCGDVGELSREEVNLIKAGGNYGWPYMEGLAQTFRYPNRPQSFASISPIWSYARDTTLYGGQAVIGGVVYTGAAVPGLNRAYIFGDNVRGHIWALFRSDLHGTNQVRWLTGEPGLSTFGFDPRDNEVLVASLITGKIRKLVYRDPATSTFPRLLSQTGLFSDTARLLPAKGVAPYNVNVSFWSDNAEKRRWFMLPENEKFVFSASNHWSMPSGTVWIKHFDMDLSRGDPSTRRRLETRLLVKNASDFWGVTYKWNGSGQDAELVDSTGLDEPITITERNGVQRQQVWHYPGRVECRLCHNPLQGGALAFDTAQLNCPEPASATNQFTAMTRNGYLEGVNLQENALAMLADASVENSSTELRVRSYFQANCAACHFPGNPIVARWDARFHTAINEKGLDYLVKPGSPQNSMLFTRVAIPDPSHMPPIATSEINSEVVKLLEQWIGGLVIPPWQNSAIGKPIAKGNAQLLSNNAEIATFSAPAGEEAGEFLRRSLSGSIMITAKLSDLSPPEQFARAGIRLANQYGNFFFAGLNQDRFFSDADGKSREIGSEIRAANRSAFLKVVSEQNSLRFFTKGTADWVAVDSLPNNLGSELTAGFAVMASRGERENLARFEQISILSGTLMLSEARTNQIGFASGRVTCSIQRQNYSVQKVQFTVNGENYRETALEPFEALWSTNIAGTYNLGARIIGEDGSVLNVPEIIVPVQARPAEAWAVSEDSSIQGDWVGRYGTVGYFAPGFTSWPHNVADINFQNTPVARFAPSLASKDLLSTPDKTSRSLSYWSDEQVTFSIAFHDQLLHKVSLYFADPEGLTQTQRLQIRDKNSRAVLVDQQVRNFTHGLYLTFFINGDVEFQITGAPARLLGVFLDSSPFPPPDITLPVFPHEIIASSELRFTPRGPANVPLQRMEVHLDGDLRMVLDSPPYTINFTNLFVGQHYLTITAVDLKGQAVSTNIPINVLPPPGGASFLGTDDVTKGNWPGSYGREGYLIVGGATNLSSSTRLTPTNHLFYAFPDVTGDRALVSPGTDARVAACWTAPFEFSFDVAFDDGAPHQLALYVFDSPMVFREELVRVIDPVTNRVLSEQLLRDFETGKYYKWMVQGAVRFIIIAKSSTTLLAGFFVDPIPVSDPVSGVTIFSPRPGAVFPVPGTIGTRLIFSDPGNSIQRTELYLDNKLSGEFPFRFEFPELPSSIRGEHWLSAATVDKRGARRWTSPILITGRGGETNANFIKEDRNTLGDWKVNYGSEGYIIPGDSTNMPPWSEMTVSSSDIWFWNRSPEAGALARRDGGEIASAWYESNASAKLTLNLRFLDGEYHRVALYFLDYQFGERLMNIRVINSLTGTVLDERNLSNAIDGVYMVWLAKGDVRFEISCANTTPILNAFFIDGGFSYSDWISSYFGPSFQTDPIAGPTADPDNDGTPNMTEFLSGSNPLRADRLWYYRYDSYSNELVFDFVAARNRMGVFQSIEATRDLLNWESSESLIDPPAIYENQNQRIIEYRIPFKDSSSSMFLKFGAYQTD